MTRLETLVQEARELMAEIDVVLTTFKREGRFDFEKEINVPTDEFNDE